MKKLVLPFCLCISSTLYAQPFLDIAKMNYSYSPEKGLGKKQDSLRSNFFNINLTLPIELKKGGDAFIINPFFDHNQGTVSERDFHVISHGLFIGFLKKNIFTNWNLLSSFILRRNKQAGKKLENLWQYGGVILTTWQRNQFAALKFGVYYNKEFFGNYFMPLVGIDWKINAKSNLFGVLPGSMVLEHKVNERFYYGSAFRALINSYRLQTIDPCFSGDCSARNYLRVDDNQLGIFADRYLTKKIVVTGEVGYTILRRYRFGSEGQDTHRHTDYKNDNFYFRTSLAYRLRFR
ncbi:MAG TPA: hypothetical protein VGQ09_14110 [Chitinophagaceae bacterium]|jgi:hypothetical protein|nr:hypothetical protein [Chitinophagaceae bacterium]